jgi:hypothetical protein
LFDGAGGAKEESDAAASPASGFPEVVVVVPAALFPPHAATIAKPRTHARMQRA